MTVVENWFERLKANARKQASFDTARRKMMLAPASQVIYSRRMISAAEDPVLDQLTRVIVERFAPERIILFGSRGRGDHRPDSDYDLIVVMEQAPERGSLPNPVRDALREIVMEVDCIVDTPERYERRRDDVGTMEYVGHREGRVLYQRETSHPPQRVREEKTGPPESLAEWLRRAQNDFSVMEVAMVSAPEARDVIAFHAHQGVEKLLKAALVTRHIPPPRTHVLEQLLHLSSSDLRNNAGLQEACAFLDSLWQGARYPEHPIPDPEQVVRAIACATTIRNAVTSATTLPST